MPDLEGPGGFVVEASRVDHEAIVSSVQAALLRGPLEGFISDERFRWLAFRREDDRGRVRGYAEPFSATLYDETADRVLDVEGSLRQPAASTVSVSHRHEVPRGDELQAAFALVRRHPHYGSRVQRGERLYAPMPPLDLGGGPFGPNPRLIRIGLFNPDRARDAPRHELLNVDLVAGEVAPAAAPLGAEAASECGSASVDSCPSGGETGQADLVLRRGSREFWRLTVVRPAESSGRNGSGVELRDVHFQGRSVLARAHVPILNVEYQAATDQCGPAYRDWLSDEACFDAVGIDVAPGIRLCDQPPRTIMETGEDAGGFRGVAVHLQGNALVLTSELKAGWYRYVTRWELHASGEIRPRMGFAATTNFCTCQAHIHHAYWRLDMAIDALDGHSVQEFNNDPLLPGLGQWATLPIEAARRRDLAANRHWWVGNRKTKRGYLLVPGQHDGEADLFGAGDAWFVRFNPMEIDDLQDFTTNPVLARARLDLFVNGEPLETQDIVTWYACHWAHLPGEGADEFVGPRLIPAPQPAPFPTG